MVKPGNISHIGSFRAREDHDGTMVVEQSGTALEPEAPYEIRSDPGGYGCEDPRVTYVAILDCYVMAYVAYGPRGPEVALATSRDGLAWERLGLLCFRETSAPVADKDAALFPEPVYSPAGVLSLAIYHRPTLPVSVSQGQSALAALKAIPLEQREAISICYVPLDAVQRSIHNPCTVTEIQRLVLPRTHWGRIKVGAGTPPVRIPEGWLAVIHGVDELDDPEGGASMRYCAGIIIHDAERLDHLIYCSPAPLFVPELPGEIAGTVAHVVFPTAIDPLDDGAYDIYYGMADYEIGRGRLTLRATR
jgi:predicted GH43/DUF377 family glycosyl hydrolase